MKTIDELKYDYKKHPSHYQPIFLLAYNHYLSKKDIYETKMDSVFDTLSDTDIDRYDEKLLSYTEKHILNSLAISLSKAFEFALKKDNINASLYFGEVKGWCYILDNKPLYTFRQYNHFGLPLFKAVAEQYGLKNPIGKHTGREKYYA